MLKNLIGVTPGTKLHVKAHYNNSTSNRFNPNPNRWVYQGNMTWEEMMTPFMAVLVDIKVDPVRGSFAAVSSRLTVPDMLSAEDQRARVSPRLNSSRSANERRCSGIRHPAKGWCADRKADIFHPPQDITATGCLARERRSVPLKNVAVEIKPWVQKNCAEPRPGAPRPSPSQTVFVLRNPQGLEKHVGHRIQVSGVVGPATANRRRGPTRLRRADSPVFPSQPLLSYQPQCLDSRLQVWTTKAFG